MQLEGFELSQRRCSGKKQRRELPVVLSLCTRAVVASAPDVLVTHLDIERAMITTSLTVPPHHDHVECVSRVLLHRSQLEPRDTGVTRLGPDGVFLYFDFALSSNCGFFRTFVFLESSLPEHSKTHALERRCVGCPLCAGGPPVDFLYIRTLSRVCTHPKRSVPHHCALQICSMTRNFAHQASMYVI